MDVYKVFCYIPNIDLGEGAKKSNTFNILPKKPTKFKSGDNIMSGMVDTPLIHFWSSKDLA